MNIFVNSYRKGSKSAKALRNGLREKGIKAFLDIKNVKGDFLTINWGGSNCPNFKYVLNPSYYVAHAIDKISTFEMLSAADVRHVEALYSKEDAAAHGGIIYCRTLLTASQGDGIVVATRPEELVDAPLYTVGITDEGRKEYRVHVFAGKVIHVQEKRRRKGHKDNVDFNDKVRNLAGAWVFTIQDVNPSNDTRCTSVSAIAALGLDFGAVDIVQDSNGVGWVLEVNTACGLEGTTVSKYVDAIVDYVNGGIL